MKAHKNQKESTITMTVSTLSYEVFFTAIGLRFIARYQLSHGLWNSQMPLIRI